MFKFKKVRGPEDIGEAINTLEDSANRLESMVETAQKEKSRLHLLVGNVSDRVNQIRQSASTFEDTAEKVKDFEIFLKKVEADIQSIQKDAESLKDVKNQTTRLFEKFTEIKTQLKDVELKLSSFHKPSQELGAIDEKMKKFTSNILPEMESISKKQNELFNRYKDFVERLENAESNLKNITGLSEEFKKTSEDVSRESARITTWMAATEKMSEKLQNVTEVFETTKQKIDRLHELAEYVESKTKSLSKQKELLKKAHMESGRANGLFWEIKSKLSELEQDTEKVREMEMQTEKFNATLKNIESRFDQINAFSQKVDQLIVEYARLNEHAKELEQHHSRLGVIDELVVQLEKKVGSAKDELAKLHKASEQINLFMKRSEESQNESRSIMRQMAELMQNTERFLNRAPDVKKVLEQIEANRKRALVLENKLMEAMATATEIKDQSEQADQIKARVEKFHQDAQNKIAFQKKDLESIDRSIGALRTNLDSVNSHKDKIAEVMDKLAEVEKIYRNLDKTHKAVLQREQTALGLKDLMEQNNETFKKFDQTASEVHQKVSDILNVKSELESIEYKIASLESNTKQLMMTSDKVEKTETDFNSLADKVNGFTQQLADWQKQSNKMQGECESLHKSHENLRLDTGEVMDLFSKLSDLRSLTEDKTKTLTNYFEQAEQKLKELSDISSKSRSQANDYNVKIDEIKESIQTLNGCQKDLTEKVAGLESESDKIVTLGNSLKEKQMELATLSEKSAALENKFKDAEKLEKKLQGFKKDFQKINTNMKTMSETLTQLENVKQELVGYHELTGGLEKKIAVIASQMEDVDKLRKDLSSASLLADELKARQKSLADEESLINKAITAASKLEELVHRAEHINTKAKK